MNKFTHSLTHPLSVSVRNPIGTMPNVSGVLSLPAGHVLKVTRTGGKLASYSVSNWDRPLSISASAVTVSAK